MKYYSENMVHINFNLPTFCSFFENGTGLCFIYETQGSQTSHTTDALHAAQELKSLFNAALCKVSSTLSYTRLSYFTLCYQFDWENIYT